MRSMARVVRVPARAREVDPAPARVPAPAPAPAPVRAAPAPAPVTPVTPPAVGPAPGQSAAVIKAVPPRTSATAPKPAEKPQSPAMAPVAAFIDLEQDFRQARDLDSLRLALITGARRVVDYDCGLFLECSARLAGLMAAGASQGWRVKAATGTSAVDPQAPLVLAFEQFVKALSEVSADALGKVQMITLDADCASAALHEQTRGFPHMLWVPVRHRDGTLVGAYALFRQAPWTPQQATLATGLAGPFGHAWGALLDSGYDLRRRLWSWAGTARLRAGALLLAALVLAFPVRFSVLAPGEVVGAQPTLISAPLDGIVRDIRVSPGDRVATGDILFTLVDTKLRNDYEIALKARTVALARYQRTIQNTVANRRDSQDIAVARADLDVAEAELALAEDMLRRATVTAPGDGIAVFSSKSDWLGRPVTTGERIMDVVDPASLELKIELGVSDAMDLQSGTSVRLFLDGNPLAPAQAAVSRIGYRPVPNADRQMVYRVYAEFDEGAPQPRLGARGTARIDGARMALGFYLLRRPIAALRQKFGV